MTRKPPFALLATALLSSGAAALPTPFSRPPRRDKYQPCDVCRQPCRRGRCGKCQARLPLATPASRGV